jgi:hypothetical protein
LDTQPHFENPEEIEKLRTKNIELKKELEREQIRHNMLFKEWKQLSEQMSAKEEEVYENSKPKNLFYKYAFYVLLIAGIPAVYFLYQRTADLAKIPSSSSSQVISDSVSTTDTISNLAVAPINDSLPKRNSTPTIGGKLINNRDTIQQVVASQPVTKPEEKKAILPDSAKQVRLIAHKPVVEKPLTDDGRDSISSEGFNAYFSHRRNPFRKASERYKAWAEGWNEGKVEAKKVVEKDPSLIHK